MFENTAWPEGFIWSDDSTLEDGRDLYKEDGDAGELVFADNDTFIVPSYWYVTWEGPAGHPINSANDGISIRSLIRKWRKARDITTFVVSIPKVDVAAATALFAERNWRVDT
ncbi:MAG: hypothetical protein ACRYGG_01070 [Janthinobacterium lividum]